jgi:hypothetical protein
MLYKRALGDDDWGQFIDIDDTQIHTSPIHTSNYISRNGAGPSYMYKLFSETCLIIIEIPRRNKIKHNCICSTIIMLGSVMLCFIC